MNPADDAPPSDSKAELRIVGTTVTHETEALFDRVSASLGRRAPRQPAHLERVELVARFRNQSRFDAIGRPGERHVRPAPVQRFGDRYRGQHVSCRPAGCDQTPRLSRRCHATRC